MIDGLELGNFKSIRHADIKIRPWTIFIGPNGSGKSNILQALMLIKQSGRNETLTFQGPQWDFISIEDISFFHNVNEPIYIKWSGHIECNIDLETKDPQKIKLSYTKSNHFLEKQIVTQAISMTINSGQQKETFNMKLGEFGSIPWNIFPQLSELKGNLPLFPSGRVGVTIEFSPKLPEPETNPIEFQKAQKLLVCLKSISQDFDNFFFIPAIRGINAPSTSLTEAPVDDFTSARTLTQQYQQLFSTLVYNREIAENISEWTQRISGVPIEGKLLPGPQATILSQGKLPINIIHEGSGLNQLVLLLSQLYMTPRESLLAIEEPEIHLHPKAQMELVEILDETITNQKLRCLISTHSEHILFALLTKIIKGDLNKSDVSIYYFEKDETGVSQISPVNITSQGTIDGGLPGFFEANMSAYKAYIDAITQNTKSGSE